MENYFWFIIATLATYRLSLLPSEEIFRPLREWLKIEPNEETGAYPDTWIAYWFNCFFCRSVWMAALATILLLIFKPILLIFALSGASILLYKNL